MKINVAMLMVIVLILMIIGPVACGASACGAIGTAIAHGTFPVGDAHPAGALQVLRLDVHGIDGGLYEYSVRNAIFALYASTESLAGSSPYVPRARALIDQNENRNRVLEYVTGNPGEIQNDLARSLEMNIGTLRYHLMIMELNHRVVPYQDGARLVRYFVNNGSYSREQMEMISLLKRNPTGRLLSAMAGKTGVTCAAISSVSGLPYCEVNKYMKELVARGVAVKESTGNDRYRYRIAPGREVCIVKYIGQKP